GITRGSPVFSSTYATRLFVVPRSIPMMRDMSFSRAGRVRVAERVAEVVDDRAEICAGGERLLERSEHLRPIACARSGVPSRAQVAGDARVFRLAARDQPLALRRQRGARVVVEAAGARLLQRFLDLEHFREQFRWRLRLDEGP